MHRESAGLLYCPQSLGSGAVVTGEFEKPRGDVRSLLAARPLPGWFCRWRGLAFSVEELQAAGCVFQNCQSGGAIFFVWAESGGTAAESLQSPQYGNRCVR